jgi:SAM-dependent methyltransferase
VVDGIHVLMAPERIYPTGRAPDIDVHRAPYDEAYAEQQWYTENPTATTEAATLRDSAAFLRLILALSDDAREAFPDPWPQFVGNRTEITAMYAAFAHLSPLRGATVVQLGGNGLHGLTLLAAGADRLIAVSPILAELRICGAVAKEVGLDSRVALVAGLGEELPIADGSVDAMFSPASVHHLHTTLAFPEIRRVLANGGRFSSVDVYRSPLYRLGIAMFGKKEKGASCQPLDSVRLEPAQAFEQLELGWYGSSIRYVTSVLARLGRMPTKERLYRLTVLEDRLARRLPLVRRFASVVVILGTRRAAEPSKT